MSGGKAYLQAVGVPLWTLSGVRTSIAIFRLVIASGGVGLEPLALWLPTGHHVLHTGGFRDTDLIAI